MRAFVRFHQTREVRVARATITDAACSSPLLLRALLTTELDFLYLDPVLQHHMGAEHHSMLGTSIFQYLHRALPLPPLPSLPRDE